MQFKDIEKQASIANRLTEIVDSGRVAHAQLFLGNTSSGALALALAFAQYLSCSNRQHYDKGHPSGLRADSCGTCPSCRKYHDLAHPDLHLFFPNTTTASIASKPSSADFQKEYREFLSAKSQKGTLDEWYEFLNVENKQGLIRERDADDLIKALSMKSYEGGYKVVVIWMAEKMNESAANTILKTLEEPSEKTLILLVAENSERMLSTILSRTQLIRVGDVAGPDILLRASTLDFASLYVSWMRQLFKLNMLSLSSWADTMHSKGRESQKEFLSYAQEATRECFLRSNAGLPLALDFGDEKFNASFPAMMTENNIEKINNAFNEAIRAIERNGYAKLVFMELSFRISKALKKK